MPHTHHHHHDNGAGAAPTGGLYLACIAINAAFVVLEAVIGFASGSIGLLSDAGHNLGDVFSLLLALLAFRLAATRARGRFTYGFRKSSVLISLLNAIILLVAVGAIVAESIHKIASPAAVDGAAVAWTAAAGIVVNGTTAVLLSRRKNHDINTRGAYLHMLADTLVSAGVVVSGIVISLTGWTLVDPVVGLVVAAVILVSTWELLSESVRMSIDAVPEQIDAAAVEALMASQPGVAGVHHIHIWPISTTEVALTAHLVLEDPAEGPATVHALKDLLLAQGIHHSTLEVESADAPCGELGCGL